MCTTCFLGGSIGCRSWCVIKFIFKLSNFLLFFKSRQSFHAVREIGDDVPNQRYGMQFQFYEPPGGVFTDLSEPDLLNPSHKRSGWDVGIGTRVRRAVDHGARKLLGS